MGLLVGLSLKRGAGAGGGICIPIDPFYLTWQARHYDFSTRFIEPAGEVNTGMPYWVVGALSERGRAMKGAKVLVTGTTRASSWARWS